MCLESYLSLFIAMFVVALIPGPAVFAITSTSIVSGFKRGVYMTAGLIFADYVFILLAISGLSFVAELLGGAFLVLKYLCAVYLIYLRMSLFFAKESAGTAEATMQSQHSAVVAGFLLTLSNPKAILFYVALFPAFVDIGQVSLTEILGIMACATLAFGSVNLGYAYLASRARKLFASSKNTGVIKKCAGTAMFMSGVTVGIRA